MKDVKQNLMILQCSAALLAAFAWPYAFFQIRMLLPDAASLPRNAFIFYCIAFAVAATAIFAFSFLARRAWEHAEGLPASHPWWYLMCHIAAVLIFSIGAPCTLLR